MPADRREWCRAALDVALALDIPCGGWCPKGRRAEDGAVPEIYPLTETPSADDAERRHRSKRAWAPEKKPGRAHARRSRATGTEPG